MLHSVSLFNEYSDLLSVIGDDDFVVHKPIPLNILRERVADLQPSIILDDLVTTVRDLLQFLYQYRET